MKTTLAASLAASTCLAAAIAATWQVARAAETRSAQVQLPPIPVMCLDASGSVMGAGKAFATLDTRLGAGNGRRYYGVYDAFKGLYRACAAALPGDDPQALGLQHLTIAGGAYAQRRLDDWRERIGEIREELREMVEEHGVRTDVARPTVEVYDDRLLLLHVPIKN